MSSSMALMGSDTLLDILRQSSDATAVYASPMLLIRLANDAMLAYWGKTRAVEGMLFEEALPEMKGQPFTDLLKQVWSSGETYEAKNVQATLEINDVLKTSYFDFIYKPIKDSSGKVYGILHTATDVTDRVSALSALNEKEQREQEIMQELEAVNEEYLVANEDLAALNEEYQVTNEELATLNEEYAVINEHLEQANQLIHAQNKQFKITNDTVHKLNKELTEKEQRLQGILDTMAEGVGVIDKNGQLVYANPKAQEILGLSQSEIKERTFDDPLWANLRLDGSPLPQEEHPMAIMMATGHPVYDHEISVQPPDRERFYISINAAPIFDANGALTGGIGTFMDVTTRRLVANGKDDFISIASHELKTPVTALKASLQILQRSHDRLSPESRDKLINQSIRSIDNLSRLIGSLLDSSRLAQGQLKLERSSFSITELFEDCSAHISDDMGYKLIIKCDTQMVIEADKQQIEQVVMNFINNAIKYAPESKSIILFADKSASEIRIGVKDFGPGIPKEKTAHLFKRYYRTDYTGNKFSGLGLGLYISAEIITNHGGQIGVSSEQGIGSEFWFTIPQNN